MTVYNISFVNDPNGSIQLQGINNDGELIGSYSGIYGSGAFSQIGKTFTTIQYPDAAATAVSGIDTNGNVYGVADIQNKPVLFVEKDTIFKSLGRIDIANNVQVGDANDAGTIVGDYATAEDQNNRHAFSMSHGSLSLFDAPGATYTTATGINNSGTIVGSYASDTKTTHGFIDVNGTFTTLDVPNATATLIQDINNNGDIAGSYLLSGDNLRRGFVYSNGTFSYVGVPGKFTEVEGLNDAGQVVGFTAFNDANRSESCIATPVCFASGTAIRTAGGDVAVEHLAVGERVVTVSGVMRAIRWLGYRTLDCRGAQAAHFLPIRIAAHAFGAGLPICDLWLSPGHPVLVDADADGAGGHLVPIMCLVNGTTIARMPVDAVTYWHIELDAHDILLAEGLPAESYLDWGDRGFFTEGADHALTNPDFVMPGLAGRCRPVALDGPIVEAERRRLDALFARRLATACAWPHDVDEEAAHGIPLNEVYWPHPNEGCVTPSNDGTR